MLKEKSVFASCNNIEIDMLTDNFHALKEVG